MSSCDSKVAARYQMNTIRAMIAHAGIPERDCLVAMVTELVHQFHERGVLVQHMLDSVGRPHDDPFAVADRIRREFAGKPPLWP